jgi:predicted CXXCH cytochrome family protein
MLVVAGAAMAATDVSKECLSCHDGTNAPRMRPEVSHPFAVDYAAPQNREIRLRQSTEPSGLGSTIAVDMLVDGRVECTSCHLRHEDSAEYKFRLRTEDATQLCVICHDLR